MKIFGALAATAALVSGDSCYQTPAGYAVNIKQTGNKVHVTAKFAKPWIGFGIPHSIAEDEMPHADFVIGAGDTVYDKYRNALDNGKPNEDRTNGFIAGTQSVKTENGITTLTFERELMPTARHPIDPTKPFRILWAGGNIDTTKTGFDAAQYHQTSRGNIMVDLSTKGDCDAAHLAMFPPGTSGKGKKGGKKGMKGKKAKANLMGQGNMGQGNMGQGNQGNMMGGQQNAAPPQIAFKECPPRQTICTVELQRRGLNCIINQCTNNPDQTTGPCPSGQMACTAGMAMAKKCTLNDCVDIRLGENGH